MITIKNVNFSFITGKRVLDNISFVINKGDTLAIVGPSGCGKSTLLRIISGILPTIGDNNLTGVISIGGLSPDQYRQTGKLAFMFQEATLMPHLTVEQNIGFPLTLNDKKGEGDVRHLINIVGLTEYSKYYPKHLSGGMKTRVALARSFSTVPELLLLDEPFSALDIAWKSKLYVELEKLREETDTTVVIVTHDVQEALLLADHIIVMSRTGKIKMQKRIETNYSIIKRVSHISEYMNSVYEQYMLPIQDAIMNGEVLKNEK